MAATSSRQSCSSCGPARPHPPTHTHSLPACRAASPLLAPLGRVVEWTLGFVAFHPHHLHTVPFQIAALPTLARGMSQQGMSQQGRGMGPGPAAGAGPGAMEAGVACGRAQRMP